jgi:amidase
MGQLAPLTNCPNAAAAGATACPNEPPSPPQPIPGNRIVAEGWRQYIDRHPELTAQLGIDDEVDVSCSQVKVPYSVTHPSLCAAIQPRLLLSEIEQHRVYRQVTRPAGVQQWMDDSNVDAVIYPGLLGDLSVNDGGAPGGVPGPVAFARRDTPSAANGVPTLAFPVGLNPRGQPINIQFMGRAWDDATLLGFVYAFDVLSSAAGQGHQVQQTAPPLRRGHGDDDDERRDRDEDRNRHWDWDRDWHWPWNRDWTWDAVRRDD